MSLPPRCLICLERVQRLDQAIVLGYNIYREYTSAVGAGRVQPYRKNQSVGVGGKLMVSMSNYAEKIHNELGQAFSVVDENALKRASSLLAEHHADALTYLNDRSVMQSELRVLSETMRQFMMFAERRFDQVEKRIDQVDKRIDQVDKRIDHIEQRFETRFDAIDRRFARLHTLMMSGFSILAILMSLFKFIQ